MHVCRGFCDKIKVVHIRQPYYKYQRRCSLCEIWYTRDILVCPCCKVQTRGKPVKKYNRLRYERIRTFSEKPIYASMSYHKACE